MDLVTQIDITDIKQNVKFLQATVDGLADRFNQLFKEFTRQGKHEHRNELVFLLGELLPQDGINRYEYARLNICSLNLFMMMK